MTWVLIDISWLAYRAMYTMGDLSFGDDSTGVIFGFFDQLRSICMDDRVRSNRIAIFCDSRTSVRKDLFPDYKGKRHEDKDPEEYERICSMRKQRDKLQFKILPAMGVPVYHQEGVESDDLMAWCARTLRINGKAAGHQRRLGVMITADGDLFQCISPWVHWFDPQRHIYYDPDSFLERKGVTPKQWGEVKALSGCSTDNVPKIPGVAEKTAVKYLQGALPKHYKSFTAIESGNGQSIAKRNRKLVVLPHVHTDHITLREPRYDLDAFFHYCKKYGMMSIIHERKAWEGFFSGKLFVTRKRGE